MMALLVDYYDLEDLVGFRDALKRVEALRTILGVEVVNIAVEGGKIKLVLNVPADSIRLARETFPTAVVIA